MAIQLPDSATQAQRDAAAALEDFRTDLAPDLGRLVRLFARTLDHPATDERLYRQLGQYIADGHAHVVEPQPDELRIAFRLLIAEYTRQHPDDSAKQRTAQLIEWLAVDVGLVIRVGGQNVGQTPDQQLLHSDGRSHQQSSDSPANH